MENWVFRHLQPVCRLKSWNHICTGMTNVTTVEHSHSLLEVNLPWLFARAVAARIASFNTLERSTSFFLCWRSSLFGWPTADFSCCCCSSTAFNIRLSLGSFIDAWLETCDLALTGGFVLLTADCLSKDFEQIYQHNPSNKHVNLFGCSFYRAILHQQSQIRIDSFWLSRKFWCFSRTTWARLVIGRR